LPRRTRTVSQLTTRVGVDDTPRGAFAKSWAWCCVDWRNDVTPVRSTREEREERERHEREKREVERACEERHRLKREELSARLRCA
jgi:hypothetical protein